MKTKNIPAFLLFAVSIVNISQSYGQLNKQVTDNPLYCVAGGGCAEHISRVRAGAIDYSTLCSGYADYTGEQCAYLWPGYSMNVVINNGEAYFGDQCGIWIDWNRNGIFNDAGEMITPVGSPGLGPYTASITLPAGVTPGDCRMRIRISYTGVLSPCGSTTYGEVEDYLIKVTSAPTYVWTGALSSSWGDPGNWLPGDIPDVGDNVVIGDSTPPCVVDTYPKFCKGITISEGGELVIGGTTLHVYNDIVIAGQLSMDHASGIMYVYENIIWESGSTANISADAQMIIYGDWTFQDGSDVRLTNGRVNFGGAHNKKIVNYSALSFFNHVNIQKIWVASFTFGAPSNHDLVIKGDLFIDSANCFWHNQVDRNILIGGDLLCDGQWVMTQGVLIMNGNGQMLKPGENCEIEHLKVDASGVVTFDHTHNDTLSVGSLTIENGTFDPSGQTIMVSGNWNNQAGPAGFSELNSTVIFNSESRQQHILSDEMFDHVVIANISDTVFADGAGEISIQHLSFAGGTWKQSGGTLTVLDLVENGIYGDWALGGTGVINLHNEDGYVDLNGKLNIAGGVFNIFGGNGIDSWWPWDHDASITMTGGVLDFRETGIVIGNNPALTLDCDVSSGTIRSVHGFISLGPSFDPSGGTMELYGNLNSMFSTQGGGFVHHLTINTDPAKTILMNGIGTVKGNLTILSGKLDANNKQLSVHGNWSNHVAAGGFIPRTGTVEFAGPLAADILTPQNFYNLMVNKTFIGTNGLEIWGDISVDGNLLIQNGCLEMNAPSDLTITGNLVINPSAGLNANDAYGPEIRIGGNWTNHTTSFTVLSGFNPGSASKVTFMGSADQLLASQAPREVFNHLTIDKAAGKFSTGDSLTCTGNLMVIRGIWEETGNSIRHKISGNLMISPAAEIRFESTGTQIEMTGNQPSVISDSSIYGDFFKLIINKATGVQTTLESDIRCSTGSVFVENGVFNINGFICRLDGMVKVINNGILRLPVSSTLLMMNNMCQIFIENGGRIELMGVPGSEPEIRSNTATDYNSFYIKAGGTIAAEYAKFMNISNHGVYVQAGALIDPLHAFTGCIFLDGKPDGKLLRIDNNQVLTLRGLVFPENTWGSTYNIMKGNDDGMLYIVDYAGDFSGSGYEWDLYDRLHWVDTLSTAVTADPGYFCPGGSSQLEVAHNGGVGPFSYQWSPVEGLSDPVVQNPVASPLISTWYHVTVTDALGTSVADSIWLERIEYLYAGVSITASSNPSQPGEEVLFTATGYNWGLQPEFQWWVNGEIQGQGSDTFACFPQDRYEIFCKITSSYPCLHVNPVTSNTILMTVVPENTQVSGVFTAGSIECRGASSVVTVAGNDQHFIVEPDASVTLIAGQKILILPGTKVWAGGFLHAYITQSSEYCSVLPAPDMVAAQSNEISTYTPGSTLFYLWPNPADSWFKVRLKQMVESDPAFRAEIFNSKGELILRQDFSGNPGLEVQTSGFTRGVYLIRITGKSYTEILRVVIIH